MKICINRDIRRLFVWLISLCVALIVLLQLCLWLFGGAFSLPALVVSLLFSAAILGCCWRYFHCQQQTLDDAAAQLERFSAGDTSASIESDCEGSLYKLFHSANTLIAALSANAAREQKEKAFLRDTISDISHQLKTPLAALEIYNALLQEECESPVAVNEFAKKSETEIERIETLVQSLLKITRLDAGSIVMERQSENVSSMIQEIRDHFQSRTLLEGKRITLSGPDDAMLLCDRIWLMEAVSNIVKNALDHTEEGGEVSILWATLPSVVQIVIKDNGCGIHPEDIYHIFKRFYRSRFSKETQGIGLGLPLAKAIVEANNGAIEVESNLGQGSTFTMNFLQLTKS